MYINKRQRIVLITILLSIYCSPYSLTSAFHWFINV